MALKGFRLQFHYLLVSDTPREYADDEFLIWLNWDQKLLQLHDGKQ